MPIVWCDSESLIHSGDTPDAGDDGFFHRTPIALNLREVSVIVGRKSSIPADLDIFLDHPAEARGGLRPRTWMDFLRHDDGVQ